MQIFKNKILSLLGTIVALILCAVALYFTPMQSKDFYCDDKSSIERNEAIQNIDIPKIYRAFNTRFLGGLSFALNYKWGGLNPVGFRVTNLGIHCANAFLVYLLVANTLRLCGWLSIPALFASLLFLCHPIQTEPVNYITQRFVLLATFFYLLTLLLYIQYRCRSQKRFLFAAITSGVAAMFCKEFVVTLPVMLGLYEFYFLGHLNTSLARRWGNLAPFFLIVLIVPVLLLKTPHDVVGVAYIADASSSRTDITRALGGLDRKEYFLTELNVLPTYLRLLFAPVNQNFVYEYPLTKAFDTRTFCSMVFLLLLLCFAIFIRRSNRIVSFCILWFFVTLSVESSFIPIAHVIAEYRVYLASFGFVLLVTALIYTLKADRKILNSTAILILLFFSFLTYQRNKVWKDEFTLWNDTIQKSPHDAVAYHSRAIAFYYKGKYDQAIDDFSKAIEYKPDFARAYNDRGDIYYNKGNYDKAISDYNMAVELTPQDPAAYNNLGAAYNAKANFNQAIYFYDRALQLNPDFKVAINNRKLSYDNLKNFSPPTVAVTRSIELGVPKPAAAPKPAASVNISQDKYDKAIADFTRAIAQNPGDVVSYSNRGLAYDAKGDYDKAIADCDAAIRINPGYAIAYNNRGTAYEAIGRYDRAIRDYNMALKIDPRMGAAYYNRGFAYFKKKKFAQARADIQKAKELGITFNADFTNQIK